MASLAFSATSTNILPPYGAVSDRPVLFRGGSIFGKSIFSKKKNSKDLMVTNVATELPPTIPPPKKEISGDRKLAAWTSIRQERWEGELVVEGEIPLWLKGTYLRNGPGMWHIGDYNLRHLFDGYATLVGLHFENGRLKMAHRQIESEAYKAAKKNNKLCYREFSEAPKTDNFLSYIGDLANLFSGASLTDNANTGVVKLADGRVVCLTETIKGSIVIDPDTLDTLGEVWYMVVRMEPGTNERKVIGRVNCRGGPAPGWVHSFPVTEHYVIVPEMPLRYCAQNLLKAEPTPLYKFEWHPDSKGFVHVMCKASGKIDGSGGCSGSEGGEGEGGGGGGSGNGVIAMIMEQGLLSPERAKKAHGKSKAEEAKKELKMGTPIKSPPPLPPSKRESLKQPMPVSKNGEVKFKKRIINDSDNDDDLILKPQEKKMARGGKPIKLMTALDILYVLIYGTE
ncbi:carotenoid cleavage dioxygenase 8 [Actinidia rufa]|uniref:Carotenoid cleavage dioxygenase 8 n=1 Tax=Actinidia rufa TaxID=165716 RepID=A0A7J0GZJ0_9ERIC|nr:carotenoid cleavage dioxygenase 8 [Actinidia rufa]